jgi:hypothetical protein
MRNVALILMVLLLGGCAGHGPVEPEGVRQAERYMGLGVQAFGNDDYTGATAMFAKAQAVYRSMDHAEGMVQAGINLAETAIAIGSYERARRQVAAVEPLARRLNRQVYVNRLVLLDARALDGARQRDAALARLQSLLPEFGADDAPRAAITAEVLSAVVLRTRLAQADEERGALSQWTRRLGRSLAKGGDADGLGKARLLRFEAEVARRNGDRAGARAALEQALVLYRLRANRSGTAATLGELAALALEEGTPTEARGLVERALFIQLWILDRPGAAESLQTLARVQTALGHDAEAAEAQTWAEGLAREGEPDWKQMRERLTPE